MVKMRSLRRKALISVLVLGVGVSACSSNDDEENTDNATAGDSMETDGSSGNGTSGDTGGDTDGDTGGDTDGDTGGDSDDNSNLSTVTIMLDSATTVPPANVDGATGEGSFTVDTNTGAVSGSVTVSGTTGVPTVAHIHIGAAGDSGPDVITLTGNDDGTVWTAPEDAVLDAVGIAAFEAGELYVNVHTEANPAGELRSQLVDSGTVNPNTVTISFRNTSDTMPMTPPVVALHNAPDADNGIRIFEVGQPAIEEVVAIAENGENASLVELATGQVAAGTISAAGVAFTDPENPGPLLPGASSSVTLDLAGDDQVLSLVSMIVCSNDGFSGIDSRPLSADATETFPAPIYDAGSENNVLQLAYWVPPCGGPEGNLGDDENGSIMLHPGQSGAEDAAFDFAAGAELLEVTVTRN